MRSVCASIRREEEAVTAAVGTVLLFAGVLSIIGVMMTTMIPVIDELHGAVERISMASQMTDLSIEIDQLSASSMPGDTSTAELKGIGGRFSWQNLYGGVWISAAWHEGSSLRLADALDLDRRIDLRHPSGYVGVVCFEDMRLGTSINTHYRIPAIEGRLFVSPDSGLMQSQGPLAINFNQDGQSSSSSIADYQIWSSPTSGLSEAWLSLDGPAQVILLKGVGGMTLIKPQASNPANGEGRAWRVPMLAGSNSITLVSSNTMDVDWMLTEQEGSDLAIKADSFHEGGATWHRQWVVETDSILHIQSSADARLLLSHNSDPTGGIDIGSTIWPGKHGSLLATSFQPPGMEGNMILQNPGQVATTVRWGTGAISVAAGSATNIIWPPQGSSAPELTSGEPISLIWTGNATTEPAARSGLDIIPASDTARISGHSQFNVNPASGMILHPQVAGVKAIWSEPINHTTIVSTHDQTIQSYAIGEGTLNISADVAEDGLRLIAEMGDSGMLSIPHDGAERCRAIGIRASGWISTILPWQELSTGTNSEVAEAWQSGSHPSSIRIEVLGPVDDEPLATLSTAWAIHSPRLVYTFASSIQGLEVAMRAGAVVTNHPEVEPSVIKSPVDRSGPGPRFALTIPLVTPSQDSHQGAGRFAVELELQQRLSLSSAFANEVRRGWDGPYGGAIAAEASKDLRHSEDWTAAPMRLDMLNDYKGWVPHPAMDSSETIYHAQGKRIQFSLQVALISCTLDGS